MHRFKMKFAVAVYTEEEDGTLGNADHQTDNNGNDNNSNFASFGNWMFLAMLAAVALVVGVAAIGT